MGLFDSVRGALGGSGDDEPELTDDVPRPANHGEPTPTDFRNKAVDAVQQWDATDLNFSLASLPRLDTFADRQGAVLDVMHEDRGDDADIARMHTGYTIQAGSYFGEVLVREAGGDWTRAGEAWAVQVPTGESETIVDVFEVAAHSFAEAPIFVETARELGIEIETEDDEEDDAEPEGPDVRPEMRETAENVADTWDAYDLDFSPASVVRLDDLLEREFDPYEFDGVDVTGDDMEAKMYRERLKQLGSYFGEVLVRHLDGEWSRRDGEVAVDVSAGRDGWVTVPVFDVAGEGLRGAPRFVLEYNRCIEDAGVEAKPVDPSEPANDADHDASLDTGVPDAATDATAARDATQDQESAAPVDAAADGPDEEPATERPETSEPAAEAEHAAGEPTPDSPMDSDARTTRGEQPARDPAEPEQTPATEPADATRQADPADGREESTDEEPAADEPHETEEEYNPEPARGADDDAVAAAADALAGGDDEPSSTDSSDSGPAVDEGETLDLGGGGGGPEPLTAADVTEDAKQFAATWPGYELDFSPKSLERLDQLVREEYDTDAVPQVELDGTGVDDSYLTARIVETGGYFAEVLRRSVGGEWREGEALAFVVGGRRGETRLDPVAIAADCFDGAESFATAYADVRNSVGASAGSDGR